MGEWERQGETGMIVGFSGEKEHITIAFTDNPCGG